jgi:hypothetical protein
VLTHPEIRQGAIDRAYALFETASGSATTLDLLFSLENEKASGREHGNGHRAQRQSDRT